MRSVLTTNDHLLRAISSLSTQESYHPDVDKGIATVMQALDRENMLDISGLSSDGASASSAWPDTRMNDLHPLW